jgi:hypothetical protein
MVDMNTYKLMHEEKDDDEEEAKAPAPREELSDAEMYADAPPAEPFALLLPPSIRGYGFHNKKWSRCRSLN